MRAPDRRRNKSSAPVTARHPLCAVRLLGRGDAADLAEASAGLDHARLWYTSVPRPEEVAVLKKIVLASIAVGVTLGGSASMGGAAEVTYVLQTPGVV